MYTSNEALLKWNSISKDPNSVSLEISFRLGA
jgi:hypothetical protein